MRILKYILLLLVMYITPVCLAQGEPSITLFYVSSTTPNVKYNVYRGTASGQESKIITLRPNYLDGVTQVYYDFDIVRGTTYYYYTTAVDETGVESLPSPEVSGVVPVLTGTDIFVQATASSDANPCSLASPCATIQHAVNIATPGSRIYLRCIAGISTNFILSEPIVIDPLQGIGVSGTIGQPILITNYPTDLCTPQVTRATVAPNTWVIASTTSCGANCVDWTQDVAGPNITKDLYYNGTRRLRPRQKIKNSSLNTYADTIMCDTPVPFTQAQADIDFGAPTPFSNWSALTVYPPNSFIQDNNNNIEFTYAGGTSGAVQPIWTTSQYNVLAWSSSLTPPQVDGSVRWTMVNSTAKSTARSSQLSQPCTTGPPANTEVYRSFSRVPYVCVAPSTCDINPNWHNLSNPVHQVEVLAFEVWTAGRVRLKTCHNFTEPTRGYCDTTGPFYLSDGNSGIIPGNEMIVDNVQELAIAGNFYEDICPTIANCSAPEATFKMHVYNQTGDDPNTANIFWPSGDMQNPQILIVNNTQYWQINGISLQLDNWNLPPQGLPDSQGMPKVPSAISFNNDCSINFTNNSVYHIAGGAIELQGPYTVPCTQTTLNNYANNITYDVGAGGFRDGRVGDCNADTDLNVPAWLHFFNNGIAYHGLYAPSGEGTGFDIEDAHDAFVYNNDIYGGVAGEANIGHGLNRAACPTPTPNYSFYMYNLHFEWNDVYGRIDNTGLTVARMTDFGVVYTAWNWSAKCPTLTAPSLSPFTYCNIIAHNRIHEGANNYNDHTHNGAVGLYCDQACSVGYFHQNVIYRISNKAFNHKVPSHGQVDPATELLPQYNLFDNNIVAWCGSIQLASKADCWNLEGENQNSVTLTHNIFLINGSFGSAIQNRPGPGWWCGDGADHTTVLPCSAKWLQDYNVYYDVTGAAVHMYTCITSTCAPFNASIYTTWNQGAPWGYGATEDVHSPGWGITGVIDLDPHMINPIYPIDNYNPTNKPLMDLIGFKPWQMELAGRVAPFQNIPSNVPNPYGGRYIDATQDYVVGYTPTPIMGINNTGFGTTTSIVGVHP